MLNIQIGIDRSFFLQNMSQSTPYFFSLCCYNILWICAYIATLFSGLTFLSKVILNKILSSSPGFYDVWWVDFDVCFFLNDVCPSNIIYVPIFTLVCGKCFIANRLQSGFVFGFKSLWCIMHQIVNHPLRSCLKIVFMFSEDLAIPLLREQKTKCHLKQFHFLL